MLVQGNAIERICHPLLQLAVRTKVPESSVQIVVCPDLSYCPDGNTCCPSSSGYNCCPQPNAVCCSDMKHCCPEGYPTCDVGSGKCYREDISHPLLQLAVRTKVPESSVQNVVCPDGQSYCPDGNTCCPSSSGSYSCCPRPNAVCCSDMKHCCPEGYPTCDVGSGKCYREDMSHPLLQLAVRTKVPESSVQIVVCPDGQSYCPDGNTCCPSSSGYNCCPQPNAVCCSDMMHCCPEGYPTCDVGSGKCYREDMSHPLLQLAVRTKVPESSVQNVVCPDLSYCPDGNTCCPSSSGSYNCCPRPNAVCCSDMKHCCPEGYPTCDVGSGKCYREDMSHPLLQLAVRTKELKLNVRAKEPGV